MAKAGLSDDSWCWGVDPNPGGVTVGLSDDCCVGGSCCVEEAPPEWPPLMTVMLRTRTGYTDDGNPVFTWSQLAQGAAIVWEQRTEWDAEAGFTQVKAKLVMTAGDLTKVPETAVVVDPQQVTWRITASDVRAGVVTLQLARIDAE